VKALAAKRATQREARQLRTERREAQPPPRTVSMPTPGQEATTEELELAAQWTRKNPGPFIDSDSAAPILGVTPQYVGRLAARSIRSRPGESGTREVKPGGATPAEDWVTDESLRHTSGH
jgi:hypothetical protein